MKNEFKVISTIILAFSFIRRVVINHEHEMPSDYGTTPGGTMFAHTPGGMEINNYSYLIYFDIVFLFAESYANDHLQLI